MSLRTKITLALVATITLALATMTALVSLRLGEDLGRYSTAENLAVKRPGTGISPMRWDEMLGQVARRDYAADELIES